MSQKNMAESLKTNLEMISQWGVDILPRAQKTSVSQEENKPEIKMNSQNLSFNESRLKQLCDDEIGNCTRCVLHKGRTKLVFGVGNPNAELMFVGEGPGADEDLKGEPFVGRAGQLLTKMIEAMGLKREDIYIANLIKCRPPNNRNPEPSEIAQCMPFLKKQIEIIGPKVIVSLGKFASQTLLQTEVPITKLRGEFQNYGPSKLMPTYHPAFLLRNPNMKKFVWEDLQKVMKELGIVAGC
ncbi:MAG TPA: hypothetical protein DDW49_09250 [Deltaproteobacteria bacterium]|nr:MAG: hypothetical protein A2048_08670 [Deltaproteobacteria bacterium GWA2_45_12]HBF13547.1 hypothetical protein [Deltaproteobacteria bacterium]